MNDASRNTVKGNSLLWKIPLKWPNQFYIFLGVAATFGMSSRGRITKKVENRCSSS